MIKPDVLYFENLEDWDADPMNKRFNLYQFPQSGKIEDLNDAIRNRITAFAFKGHSDLTADIMDAFPNLGLIANYGVGYDTIDVAAATQRGIGVTNTPDVLTNDVADLAVGMLLAINRDILGASQWIHSGQWKEKGAYPLQRTLCGCNVGIAGLGRIGMAVANRLQGFDTEIHYYSRKAKSKLEWIYHDNLIDLAKAVDILMVTVSGGPDTQNIISEQVIDALGADALIVNCSRGSTVDEESLLNALENKTIRGFASDVFYNEPDINPRFFRLDNVLLQPHQSSGTVETRKKMGELQRNNLIAFFNGQELVTPVN